MSIHVPDYYYYQVVLL